MESKTITVLGAGSWGTALAMVLARLGHQVRLWGRDRAIMTHMSDTGRNDRYLPGIVLPETITYFYDLSQSLKDTDDILVVVPTHVFPTLLEEIAEVVIHRGRLCWACKGLDPDTNNFLDQTVAKLCGPSVNTAILSGPSFAQEVAEALPTAVTLASESTEERARWASYFHYDYFRVYTSSDMVGVQLGGAVKNILAVATGVAEGLGFRQNTQAALITRGLAEMSRLGAALGAQTETLMGLSGVGDVILTCTGNGSRNRRFGIALGQGQTINEALASIGQVVESIHNVKQVWKMAQQHGVDMPITEQMHQVILKDLAPATAVKQLLAREQKEEV